MGSVRNQDDALAQDPEQVARTLCLRMLAGQPRTRAELAAHLRRKGVPGEAAEAVLARFGEVGLIDDKRFAEAWVSSRHSGRGLARGALAGELRRRGVAGETVDAAVAQIDAPTEEATARALVDKRMASVRGLPADKKARRLLSLLARRGYPQAMSARVVRRALEADERPVGDEDGPDAAAVCDALESLEG